MKIVSERTVILAGQKSFDIAVQPDGTVALSFSHDGVRMVVTLEGDNDPRLVGGTILECGAIARAVREAQKAEGKTAEAPAPPLRIAP
jgi:hypothetical protein